MEVVLRKCKVGRLRERYVDGEWKEVDSDDRYALIDPDTNRHNGDLKVAYASDTLLVFRTGPEHSHDDLRQALESAGINTERFFEIEVPTNGGYAPAFKTTPSMEFAFDSYYGKLELAVERDMDIRGDDKGCSAYLSPNDDSDVDGEATATAEAT